MTPNFEKLESVWGLKDQMIEVKEFHKMALCVSLSVFELLDTKAFKRAGSRVNSNYRFHILCSHHLHSNIVLIGVKHAKTEVFLFVWSYWEYFVEKGIINICDIDFNYLRRGSYGRYDSCVAISDLNHFYLVV